MVGDGRRCLMLESWWCIDHHTSIILDDEGFIIEGSVKVSPMAC